MKTNGTPGLMIIIVLVLGMFFGGCEKNLAPVPEIEYSTKIIGSWLGTDSGSKETMTINKDGTFVCKMHSTGFIANTLSQRRSGTISGTWKITGTMITLNITGSKNDRLENHFTSSKIMDFKEDELTLKSDQGETSVFQKIHIHWYNSDRRK